MRISDWDVCIFGHPEKSGVYAICTRAYRCTAEHIIYIGSTTNLKNRLANPTHPYRVANNRFPCYVKFYELDDNLISLEAEMIRAHKPLLNKQFNV